MTGSPGPEAIAIAGPTATGKTGLSIAVARALDGEIISVDSRQAYRGMEIGTAAPTREERVAVPHHGVGFLAPEERYGAGRFARVARCWVREIRRRDRVPILTGGTGLFLKALLEPVFREPEMEPGRRELLRSWAARQAPDRLARWVSELDPELGEHLDRLDPQRATRTLELVLLSGRPLSWWLRHGEPEAPALHAICYSLTLPPDVHRARIRARAERSLDSGWIQEARRLVEEVGRDAPALDAVGYRAVMAMAAGEADRAQTLEQIFADTWAYARRQRTWFRHQLPGAVRLDAGEPTGQLAQRLVGDWESAQRRYEAGGEEAGR